MPNDITAVLAGPVAGRAPLLAVLQNAGVNVGEQPEVGQSYSLPVDELGWITVLVDDLAVVEEALEERAKDWALRLHWNTPPCRACSGHAIGPGGSACLHCMGTGKTNREYTPPDRLAALEARIAALEGR